MPFHHLKAPSPPTRFQLETASPLQPAAAGPGPTPESVLCQHCGRSATNGVRCQGYCVTDVDT